MPAGTAVPLPGPFPLLTRTSCQGTGPRRQMLQTEGVSPGPGPPEQAVRLERLPPCSHLTSLGSVLQAGCSSLLLPGPVFTSQSPPGSRHCWDPWPCPQALRGQSHSSVRCTHGLVLITPASLPLTPRGSLILLLVALERVNFLFQKD